MKAKSFSIQAWSARFGQSKTHVPNSLSPFFFSLLLSISIFSLIFHSQSWAFYFPASIYLLFPQCFVFLLRHQNLWCVPGHPMPADDHTSD